MPTPTPFVRRAADTAQKQFDKFHLQHEHDPELSAAIRSWYAALGFTFESVDTPWSAVFVSWCMFAAGATRDEFKFAQAHSVFVHTAIQNGLGQRGVFRAFPVDVAAPQMGDIIQHNRGGNHFNFEFAKTHPNYISHSAIVVETGQDAQGKFAVTIGGNEGDSVGMKVVRLQANGRIRQRDNSPFICVIRDLK
jgi:hypothetical protein